jgi:hypothetical protein
VLHSKHVHAAFASSGSYAAGSVGTAAAAGVAGSSGSFTGSGGALGLLGGGGIAVPKVQRVMSESAKPEAIAKGFAGDFVCSAVILHHWMPLYAAAGW